MIGHRLRGLEMKLRTSPSGSMGRARRGRRLWVLEGLEDAALALGRPHDVHGEFDGQRHVGHGRLGHAALRHRPGQRQPEHLRQ